MLLGDLCAKLENASRLADGEEIERLLHHFGQALAELRLDIGDFAGIES